MDDLIRAHRSRPDIRLYPAELGGKALVIDVSLTSNILQHGQGSTPATALLQVAQRERLKNDLYKVKVEAGGNDVFLPVVGTAFGAFSTVAQPLFDGLAHERDRMTPDEVRAAVGSIAARARAHALINAERQAGVPHKVIAAIPSRVSTTRKASPSTQHEEFLRHPGQR